MQEPWSCPYCGRQQIVTNQNFAGIEQPFPTMRSKYGYLGLSASVVICSNPDCGEPTLSARLVEAGKYSHSGTFYISSDAREIGSFHLLPESVAKPLPEYIPDPIRADYLQACRIRDLSPKASATLARRCLQGMIRDFTGVKAGTLYREIEQLKTLVDEGAPPKGVSADSVDAMHHMRSIGNIGAHMEKDINIIVEVDPEEAQLLIELLETLFDEWYIARQRRTERFERLRQVASEKDQQRRLPKPDES